ncbi:MAG: ATP-binding protein [SAR202 cluster bacterium]|nr:ATP-binding protein [SAR202 cluster bacterium]
MAQRSTFRTPADARMILSSLFWMRASLLVVGIMAVGLTLAGIVPFVQNFGEVCQDADCINSLQMRSAQADVLERVGLTPTAYSIYLVIWELALAATFAAIGLLIALRSSDRVALFGAIFLMAFIVTGLDMAAELSRDYPIWEWPTNTVEALGNVTFLIFYYLFPNGRFVPKFAVALAIAWALLNLTWLVFPEAPFNAIYPGNTTPPSTILVFGIFTLSGILAQVYRHTRTSNTTERQQNRLILFGIGAAFIGGLLRFVPPEVSSQVNDTAFAGMIYRIVALPLSAILVAAVPVLIGVSVLRYRLWNINVFINRTLVYAVLLTSVAGIYVLMVGALGQIFQSIGNVFFATLATGIIALLFNPMRLRLQRAANRLMYGEQNDPMSVLTGLNRQLESSLQPGTALYTIVQTVSDAMRLPYASIALRGEGSDDFRTVAEYRSRQLSEGEDKTISFPLVYQGETIGQLRVAPRQPGEGLTSADRQLLQDVSSQASVAAQTVRLTQELETRVRELQESRSRIVTVQESARREIASHLHGRAQGRLLLTSAKLQKALTDAGESSEIAGPIQDAIRDIDQVINDELRVLSRRLYPSILDLGLIPGLESLGDQFAEAFEVQVSADEALQDEELDNPGMMPHQVRLAGYRVAEEALANAVKHAEASRVEIRIERSEDGALTLQIVDDGKGFDASSVSTGLGTATIYDQIGAVGGEVSIRSVPGEGTTVMATLPLARG